MSTVASPTLRTKHITRKEPRPQQHHPEQPQLLAHRARKSLPGIEIDETFMTPGRSQPMRRVTQPPPAPLSPANPYQQDAPALLPAARELEIPTSAQRPRPELTPDSDSDADPIPRSSTRRSNNKRKECDLDSSSGDDARASLEPPMELYSPSRPTNARSPAKTYGTARHRFPPGLEERSASQLRSKKTERQVRAGQQLAEAQTVIPAEPEPEPHQELPPPNQQAGNLAADLFPVDEPEEFERPRQHHGSGGPAPPRHAEAPMEHIVYDFEDWRKRRRHTDTHRAKESAAKRRRTIDKIKGYEYPTYTRFQRGYAALEDYEEGYEEDDHPIRMAGRRGKKAGVRNYIDDEAEESDGEEDEEEVLKRLKQGLDKWEKNQAAATNHDAGASNAALSRAPHEIVSTEVWGTSDDPLAYAAPNAEATIPQEDRRPYNRIQRFGRSHPRKSRKHSAEKP